MYRNIKVFLIWQKLFWMHYNVMRSYVIMGTIIQQQKVFDWREIEQ